jgi:hypothetical protein
MDIQNELFTAIARNNSNRVRELVGLGANINGIIDRFRFTPLTYAVIFDKPEMIRLLIELGANIEATDNNETRPLMAAVAVNSPKMVRLLVKLGANIEVRSNSSGTTILMGAIFVDRPEIVRLLIELGANIEARDNDGYTALMHARDNQAQTMINIITEAVRTREIREKNKQIRAQKEAFYLSMIKESPRDKSASLASLYDELSNFNPYLLQDIDEYAFGEEEKEEGAEESKRGDAGARRKKSKNKRKKSRSRKRKSGTGKSKRSKRKSVSRKYCLTTPVKKMGFSQKASCKAQGLLKRTSKKNKGKYIVSPKYKKKRSRRSRRSRK